MLDWLRLFLQFPSFTYHHKWLIYKLNIQDLKDQLGKFLIQNYDGMNFLLKDCFDQNS